MDGTIFRTFFETNGDHSRWYSEKYIERLELELASTKKMLDEALKIINMVQDNRKMPHKHLDYFERLCCLSERATEFLAKHEKKEGV